MLLAAWTALLAGATLTGTALVGSMALPRGRDILSGAAALAGLGFTLAGLVGIAVVSTRVDEALVASFLALAAFLGGFALGGAFISQMGADTRPPSLPDVVPGAEPRAAVVLLADAEPEGYRLDAVAHELRTLAEAGVQLPPEPTRVFVFLSEKSRYGMLGGSPARRTVRGIGDRLWERLSEDGDFAAVHVAWCDDQPTLDEVVAFAAERGSRDIIVAELMVGESFAAVRAKRRVDAMRTTAHGIRVAYAQPLWSSALVAERLADRVIEALGDTPPGDAGVALLGNGQPAEMEEVNPQATEHETFFHQRVRALLIERGFEAQRVRLGWLEWQEPGVTELVRHLAALGCSPVLVVPSAMPADGLSTLIDVPDGIVQARVEGASTVVTLPAWGDDQVIAEALASLVREAAADLKEA